MGTIFTVFGIIKGDQADLLVREGKTNSHLINHP